MRLPAPRSFLPLVVAVGVLAAICAGTVWGFLYLEFRAPFRGAAFDPAAWQAAKGAAGTLACGRCEMVRDLIDARLPGERAAVARLLGPPDKTGQAARGFVGCDAYLLGLDLRVSAWWNEAWLYVCPAAAANGPAAVEAFPLVF